MSLGFTQAIWFKESATYGSAETMSTGTLLMLPVRPNITLKKSIERIKSEHIRGEAGMRSEDDAIGLVNIDGGFGGLIPSEGISWGYLLKHTLGSKIGRAHV